jgi:hypothetical protein
VKTFLQRHQADIYGVLSGFDRVRFRGTRRAVSFAKGVRGWLWMLQVLLKNLAQFLQGHTKRLKEATEELAKGTPVGRVHYVNSSTQSKEEVVARLVRQRQVPEDFTGLVAVLSCVEPCRTFGVYRNRERKKLELRSMFRKCLHYYLYIRHPKFGLLHIRIQSWFPFQVQVCMNGREWLAKQMDEAGIAYARQDNTFGWVEDFAAAQKLFDKQMRTNWSAMLSGLLRAYHPGYVRLLKQLKLPEPYWTAEQTEWATDVSFRSAEALGRLFPRLVRHAVHGLGCTDTMRFLQQKLTKSGAIPRRLKKEVVTDFKVRPEGMRVKHRVGANSVKAYDKLGFPQKVTVLRAETTVHDAEGLKVYRPTEGNPDGPMRWLPLRRGVADLHRRCELSQRANEAYLEAMAVVDAPETLGMALTPLSQRVKRQGRRFRGLQVMSADDRQVLAVLNRGEYTIMGIRNRDLRAALYGQTPADAKTRKQQSARVSRWLALMQAHGLIRKVHRSHRYLMTDKGRLCATAVLAATDANIQTLAQAA